MYKPRISCFTLSSTSNDCQVFEILHFFFLIHIPILDLRPLSVPIEYFVIHKYHCVSNEINSS